MKFLYPALALLLTTQIALIQGCRCRRPQTLKKAFFAPSTSLVIRATVVYAGTLTNPQQTRVFALRVVTVYKGCDVPDYIIVSSRQNRCGVDLEVGEDYIFPLTSDSVPAMNLCQFIRVFSSLSTEDMEFLARRPVCCDGNCECVNGDQVNCLAAPCLVGDPPCGEATECRNNFCGGCFAEWFTRDGTPAC